MYEILSLNPCLKKKNKDKYYYHIMDFIMLENYDILDSLLRRLVTK